MLTLPPTDPRQRRRRTAVARCKARKAEFLRRAGWDVWDDPCASRDEILRIVRAECTCNFFQQNKLHKGPCEHMLALRIQHQREVH